MITTLTGNNNYALKHELNQRLQAFVAKHGDLALERLDGEEVEPARLRQSVESLPFLASHKLVVVRGLAANKAATEQLEDLLGAVTDSTDLILYEPKLDKRSSYYKRLKKQTAFHEFNEMDDFGLAKWLSDQAKQQGGSLNSADARYLVERVGANQQLLSHELDKLLAYNPVINRQTIELLTDKTPQSSIFELLDAAFAGRQQRALQLYDEQRRQRVEPPQILALIVWQLHAMAVVKTAGDRPAEQIAQESKLSPFVVRKSQAIGAKLTLVQLKQLIKQALDLDTAFKSQSIDADDALQQFLLSLGQLISS